MNSLLAEYFQRRSIEEQMEIDFAKALMNVIPVKDFRPLMTNALQQQAEFCNANWWKRFQLLFRSYELYRTEDDLVLIKTVGRKHYFMKIHMGFFSNDHGL